MKVSQRKISRRDMVTKLGVGAAAAVAVSALPAGAKAAEEVHKHQYGMVIDTRRCSGCQACSVACKAEFDVPLGHTRSWVETIEKGHYPAVSVNFLPRLCNHCRHPACVDVCPTGATFKRSADGIVDIDPDVCIGCKYCLLACPYDARFINPLTGSADKCSFCLHRVSQGVEPSCVNTCPGKARIFGDVNDPESEISKVLATNPVSVLRPGMGTEPQVYYIAADYSDEHYRERGWHVKVTTHRRQKERR